MPIKVLRNAADLRAWRASAGTLGFVPTMGALHEGHLSHLARARRECGTAIASIFVNPTQFAPHEDFNAYPRAEGTDLALLEGAGAAAAFLPSVEEMYPPGDDTRVIPGTIAEPLEGKARPGHLIGVATVVTKLLSLVRPDAAYFGQKDFQQLRVLQCVARDLRLGVRIAGGPTVRDEDGLAKSSRNAYLSPEERVRALGLSRGLFAARDLWSAGERDPERLHAAVTTRVAGSGEVDYVSVADPITLRELREPADRTVISLAVRVGRARLIDNVLLGIELDALERAGR